MQLRYKKTKVSAMTPRRAHASDAGLDLASTEHANIEGGRTVRLSTGLAFEIPVGFVGLLVPRSSTKARGLDVLGVIDSQYRGEVSIVVTNTTPHWQTIERDAYCAQLLIVPCATPSLELVAELEPSERGDRGFGSSDSQPAGNGG